MDQLSNTISGEFGCQMNNQLNLLGVGPGEGRRGLVCPPSQAIKQVMDLISDSKLWMILELEADHGWAANSEKGEERGNEGHPLSSSGVLLWDQTLPWLMWSSESNPIPFLFPEDVITTVVT